MLLALYQGDQSMVAVLDGIETLAVLNLFLQAYKSLFALVQRVSKG